VAVLFWGTATFLCETRPEKEPEMSEDESGELLVKEFEERTLNAARLHHLLRRETAVDDPWHTIVLAICAFDKLHLKDGWEFVLTNKQAIEDVGQLFEIQLAGGVQ
jgi:hypothetical protein